jgi:hypothetical protein
MNLSAARGAQSREGLGLRISFVPALSQRQDRTAAVTTRAPCREPMAAGDGLFDDRDAHHLKLLGSARRGVIGQGRRPRIRD